MRTFLRGLSAVMIANVCNGVLSVIIVPIAVKRLGVEGYGLFSIFSVLAGYLVLVELGLGKNLVRVLGSAPSESDTRDILRLGLGIYLVIAAAVLVLSPVLLLAVKGVLFRVPERYGETLNWIAVIAILDYLLGIPISLKLNHALSLERMGAYARFMLLSNTSRYALLLIGVLLTTRAEVAVAFVLGRRLVDLVVSSRILPALPTGSWRPRFAWVESRAILSQSSLLALSQLLQLSTVTSGSMLVNGFFGLGALGAYRSTFDIVSKVWFFSGTAGTVIYPRFIHILRSPSASERLGRVLRGVQSGSWLFYSLVGTAGSVTLPVVLKLLQMGDTPPLLFMLLLVGVLWNAHAVLSIEVLQAGGRFRAVAGSYLVSLLTMTLVFLVLAKREPVLAIGWAWVLSQLITSSLVDSVALGQLLGATKLGARASAPLAAAFLAVGALAWAGGHVVTAVSVTAAGLLFSARELPTIAASIRELRERRTDTRFTT